MLGKWTKWASLGKAAETPPRAAEANTRSRDQRDPTVKATGKAAPHQTSASTSLEPKRKLAEMTESSAGSSEPSESRQFAEVKFFLAEKNYGFLLNPAGGKDILIHRNGVIDGTVPQKGAVYWFELGEDHQRRPCAVNASLKLAATAAPIPAADPDTKELFDWAFIPLFSRESTSKAISDLASLALTEDWRYRESPAEEFDEFGILRNYIKFTFARLRHEGKVITGDRFATFNTGLVDRFYEPIFALFEKNDRATPPWKWRSFCVSGQGEEGKLLARTFEPLPKAASYFTKIDDLYFDAEAPFDEDLDHIVLDGIRRDRYPHAFLETYAGGFSLDEYLSNRDSYLTDIAERVNQDDAMYRRLRNRLKDAILLARKRVSWNYRAVVPQYYPKHNLMSFLLPISLLDDTKVDAALVVQSMRVDGKLRYQGYTIYPLAYAYRNARLVAKPISDWLDPERILGP
jgi:cold shock CspA family protein